MCAASIGGWMQALVRLFSQGFCSVCWLCACGLSAQTDHGAQLEVSVVRPHPPDVMHNNFSFQRNRFELEDQPLLKLIAYAYALNPKQIAGVPAWVGADHWDMSGKTNLADDATLPQQQEILRQLLHERFGLQFYWEKREMPAYALRVVKQGLLKPTQDAAAQPLEWSEGENGVGIENYRSSTMTYFLAVRQLFMDRPLVDETGLSGRYDFKLTYARSGSPDVDAPPFFTATKEQLGLKFEPVKAPVNMMLVDRVTKPTDN